MFVRYTFMVLLGLSCILALFISVAYTGAIVAHTGSVEAGNINAGYNPSTTFWIWGFMSMGICLWLSSSFILKVPFTILHWLIVNKDHVAAYSVIGLIFVLFVVA